MHDDFFQQSANDEESTSEEMPDLETENQRLRQRLQHLHACALETEALFERHQEWEIQLLSVHSLDKLLLKLTDGVKQRFDLQQVRLLLDDPDHLIRALLMRMGMTELNTCTADVRYLDAWEGHLAPLQHTLRVGALSVEEQALLFAPEPAIHSAALLPLLRDNRLLGLLVIGSSDPHRYAENLGTLFLHRLSAIVAVCLENCINRAQLEVGGLTDPLTGLHNRRSLDQRLANELARAHRHGTPLGCLFIDLDYFKQINDVHGHAIGDAVLIELATRLQSTLRINDIAARFGGDELIVLMPSTDIAEAHQLGERIHSVVTEQPFAIDTDKTLPLSVSIGVASLTPDTTVSDPALFAQTGNDLLQAADQALYAAKHAGRNQVVSLINQ